MWAAQRAARWELIRRDVFERDSGRCQICGADLVATGHRRRAPKVHGRAG